MVFVLPGFALARFLNDRIEARVIDAAVNGVADFFLVEAKEFPLIQTGRVRSYALWTLGGAIGVVLSSPRSSATFRSGWADGLVRAPHRRPLVDADHRHPAVGGAPGCTYTGRGPARR